MRFILATEERGMPLVLTGPKRVRALELLRPSIERIAPE